MKIIKIITIIFFSFIILLPGLNFNFVEDAISEIDNRKLAKNPFTTETTEDDLTDNIQNYINDRIGFRDEMILSYTVLNDTIFDKMVHPSYVYGEDGYVFGAGITTKDEFSEYHIAFADMVKSIQDYCEDRDIPFVFVFNPAKPAVLSEYIAKGTNYNRSWVDKFFEELDEREINYVDNTVLLLEKHNSGEIVFNKKYDANHWNDLGAFYGTNNVLKALSKYFPNLHINEYSELVIENHLETSLPVSNFPIKEYVPQISIKNSVEDFTYLYSNVERHYSFKGMGYYINPERKAEGSPKSLVFQGSYMNGFGGKYFANAFGEYIHIHDYQNVINFPYYFNIFKPDCVIFEVAEYTFSNTYFNYGKMLNINYNPPLDFTNKNVLYDKINADEISFETDEKLTKISLKTQIEAENVWLLFEDEEYDMIKTEEGYSATIMSSETLKIDNINIVVFNGEEYTIFK